MLEDHYANEIKEFLKENWPDSGADVYKIHVWSNQRCFEEVILPQLKRPSLKVLEYKGFPQNKKNCYQYIFGVEEKSEVNKLLHDFEEVNIQNLNRDDFVVYFCENKICHVGKIVKNDTVESKWSFGPIFHHKLLDIPYNVSDIKFYRKPNL